MALLSVLDLAPIPEGSTPGQSLRNSLDLRAAPAEPWGFNAIGWRNTTIWRVSPGAATSVAIGYVAGRHQNIRVGSGGIMLPNHSPR